MDQPPSTEDCLSCRSISGEAPISPGPRIFEGKHWLVEHAYPIGLLGWIVIVLRRHTQALHELTRVEFLELSRLQHSVTLALQAETECQKEYSMCFGEAPGFNHVHFHVVPRAKDMPSEYIGKDVLQYQRVESVPPGEVIRMCNRLREAVASNIADETDATI